jgi:hypothetical protein
MNWISRLYRKFRYFFIKGAFRKFLSKEMAEEAGEEFLKILLKLLNYACYLDDYLQKSIDGFNGRIEFRSKDNAIRVLAEFKENGLYERELDPDEKLCPLPDATLVFKDYDALINFLLPKGGKRDCLRSLLQNEVQFEGNLNYIYRFGFLATHAQRPFFNMMKN